MHVIARGRQAGKTHDLVQWVLLGKPTNSYPFWSRVLLVPTIQQANDVRRLYQDLDYRQVFSVREWQNARLGSDPVQVSIDNVEWLLQEIVGPANILAYASLTGTATES